MNEPKPFSRAATIAARLRPMLSADLAAVLELEHELFPDDAWTPEMFADEMSSPRTAGFTWWRSTGSFGGAADQEGVPDGPGCGARAWPGTRG